jgi:hypothetical protein
VHGGLAGSLLSTHNVKDINHIIRLYIHNNFDNLNNEIKKLKDLKKKYNCNKDYFVPLKSFLKHYLKLLLFLLLSLLSFRMTTLDTLVSYTNLSSLSFYLFSPFICIPQQI